MTVSRSLLDIERSLSINAEDIRDSDVWLATIGLLGVAVLFGLFSRASTQHFLTEPLSTASSRRASSFSPRTLGESILTRSPGRASVETLRFLTSPKEDRFHVDEARIWCGFPFTENMRVLAMTAALFGTITAAQAVAAQVAKSDALLADCVSMAVDALTYLLNIFVEAREGKAFYRELQLLVPSISLSVLFYFTVSMLLEAKETLSATSGPDDDEVNPTIILGFAFLGIVFDAIALRAFVQDADKGSMNMFAAFAHVGADFVRSIVTFAAAILIMNGFDGMRTDAWACVTVTGVILGGVLVAVYELAKNIRAYIAARRTRALEFATPAPTPGEFSLELPPSPPPPFKQG